MRASLATRISALSAETGVRSSVSWPLEGEVCGTSRAPGSSHRTSNKNLVVVRASLVP